MRNSLLFLCTLAIAGLAMVGCSDDGESDGTGGAGGNGGAGGSDRVEARFFVTSYDPEGGPLTPLDGVEVCETDTSNCSTTDANGNATLELPADQETSYTLDREGYASYVDADVISHDQRDIVTSMATEARLAEMFALVMSPYPMEGTGLVYVDTVDPLAGMTLELLGTTGKQFYRDENADWSLDLTSTTSGNGGGFCEVTPGVFEIEFGGAGEGCEIFRGWPGDAANRVRLPSKEGYLSRVTLNCD